MVSDQQLSNLMIAGMPAGKSARSRWTESFESNSFFSAGLLTEIGVNFYSRQSSMWGRGSTWRRPASKAGPLKRNRFLESFYLAECENLTSVCLHRTAFRRRICGTAVKRQVDGTPRFPSWMREAGPPGHFFEIRATVFAR